MSEAAAATPADPGPGPAAELGRAPGAEPGPGLSRTVRTRVVGLAADRLGVLPAEEIPPMLRPFARFTPAKRARLAAPALAVALETDPLFRQRVAEGVRADLPELAAAVQNGSVPAAAAPEDLAAVAYLLRPPGWEEQVRAAGELANEAVASQLASASGAVADRLREQLVAARTAARAETSRLRAEIAALRSEAEELRRRLREATEQARRAERSAAEAVAVARQGQAAAGVTAATAEAESRRLRVRVEAAADTARRAVREGRSADGIRLRLLLDTVVEAATGLRRELALPAGTGRPADLVGTGEGAAAAPTGVVVRGLADDDPALVDQLLALPQVHLVVDGYNVTKLGYGGLPLETQRLRLVTGLAALAARTNAEVTCVFDGGERTAPIAPATPRNVRVLFSAAGETADELIRRLVRAEPPGRPVVVISTDREVADGVRQAGARPLPSLALLRRLERG